MMIFFIAHSKAANTAPTEQQQKPALLVCVGMVHPPAPTPPHLFPHSLLLLLLYESVLAQCYDRTTMYEHGTTITTGRVYL